MFFRSMEGVKAKPTIVTSFPLKSGVDEILDAVLYTLSRHFEGVIRVGAHCSALGKRTFFPPVSGPLQSYRHHITALKATPLNNKE